MISKKLVVLYVVFALVCVAIAWGEEPIEVRGFAVPESVFWDPDGDYYLVSNINGKPTDVDDNGFISKVAPDGTVLARKWIDGEAGNVVLSAPKGMAVFGDTLYVTDITAVRKFDRRTGRPEGSIEIPDSIFVNDPAAGPDGALYVSDMKTDRIHRIAPDGALSTFAEGSWLGQPNGLTVAPDGGVIACAMGANEIYFLDDTGRKTRVIETPAAGLDGLVRLAGGDLLVSSWKARSVYRIFADGTVTPVLTEIPSPADIGYDGKRNRILVPVFTEDRVLIVPMPETFPKVGG